MTKREAARILASLCDQRLDVRLGIISEAEWKGRVATAAALGVSIPADWRR